MSGPGAPLNCPHCGARLVYERTEGETEFYTCERHGWLVLPPDGRVRLLSVYNNEGRGRAQPR